MTDFDLDRLGDVWREQPDPAEMERLQRTAGEVSRRARFAQAIDIGAAIAVAAVVVLLASLNPTFSTFLMGGAAILVLLFGQIRQRQLRQVELRGLTGSTEDMLDQLVAQIEATLKRNRFSLVTFGPAILLGWLFMAVVTDRPVRILLPGSLDHPWSPYLWYGGFLLMLAAGAAYFIVAIRRVRRQLERLVAMRDAYREERESTAP